jgi:quinoprotein glucose dehydrogenase
VIRSVAGPAGTICLEADDNGMLLDPRMPDGCRLGPRRLIAAADSATVFAEGFNGLLDGTAAGILARRGDLFLTCIPSLYRLRDENGDGRADKSPAERAILSTGYGVRVALRGHDLHGLVLGPDGRIYFTIGDRGYRLEHDGRVDHDPGSGAVFRCEPDGRSLEVFARSLRNPQELAFDDLGNLFTVDNNSDGGDKARVVHLVPGGEAGWNMSFQYLDDRGPWSREKIWHTACDGQPAWTLPPLAHVGAGPSGMAAYPGTGLTSHFDGRFLLADFHGGAAGSSVRSFRVRPSGGTFQVFDQEETFRHILATDVEFGPDGAVWVSDWVHGWDGEGKGRLWRFRPKDQDAKVVDEVRSLLAGDWGAIDAGRLRELLDHADRRVRLEAQWELARRREAASFTTLLGETAAPLLARVHAVEAPRDCASAGG